MENLSNVPGIENVSEEFKKKVIQMAADLETDPNFLMAIMSFETQQTFSPKIRNPLNGATGLIQFMPRTASILGTSIGALLEMTAEEQLDIVARYLSHFRGKMKTLEDAYMAVLLPSAVGRGKEFVLFKSPSATYKLRSGLDVNGDGVVTVGEATERVRVGLGPKTIPDTVTVLQRGMKGPRVGVLQDELIDLGYMTLEEKKTGAEEFGPKTERHLKEFQRDNKLTDNGIYDLPTQCAIRQLNEGVKFGSKGGVVLPLQERLVAAGKLTQAEMNTGQGTFGEKTRNALITFQMDNNLTPNGILTDETYRLLYKSGRALKPIPSGDNTTVNTILPERGEGFRTFLREPGGATQVGTQVAINAFIDLARSWFLKRPEVPIQFGHISRMGGGPFRSSAHPGKLAHKTHQDGRTVDIRPIRKDNALAPTNVNLASYDPERTKELVLLIREKHPRAAIFFNDPRLLSKGLTKRVSGHNDHLHLRLL